MTDLLSVSYYNKKKYKNLHQISYYIWKEKIILELLCSDYIGNIKSQTLFSVVLS